MNVLEQYIVKIHEVKPYEEEWTDDFPDDFVEVKLTTNCYGREQTKWITFTKSEWEEVKGKGYYMA